VSCCGSRCGGEHDAAAGRRLRSVNLGWCERVTEAGVAALAAGCPGLQALDLCGCIQARARPCREPMRMARCALPMPLKHGLALMPS